MNHEQSTAVSVRSLTLRAAGREIVSGVDLHVPRGEICSVIGESGSGKTSLGLSLLGHLRRGVTVAGGQVEVLGTDMLGATPDELRRLRGHRIAYMPQDPPASLNPALRVEQSLTLPARRKLGLGRTAAREHAKAVLERVDLPADRAFLRRYPHQLSGGQQQRLVLGIATLADPDVLVMDEPTTGLDVLTEKRVLDQVVEFNLVSGLTVVYITHDLRVAREISSRSVVMYAGQVVETGQAGELLARPRHRYTQALTMASPPSLERRRLRAIRPPGTQAGSGQGCRFAVRCDHVVERCTRDAPELTPAPHGAFACFNPADQAATGTLLEITEEPDRSDAPAVLRIEGLVKAYPGGDGRVLDGVDLTVRAGSRVGLLGLSGSGKTTLLRCVAGLEEPGAGRMELLGRPLAPGLHRRSAADLRAIRYIFQNPYESLNPKRLVGSIIGDTVTRTSTVPRDEVRAEVERLLGLCHLTPRYADLYPGQLSGGERQRVAIAQALAGSPRVLLCDEVTSALDVSVRATIVELLRELSDSAGLSIVFVTHDITALVSLCDEHYVLENGSVVESGPIDTLIQAPASDLSRSLVAAFGAAPVHEESA